MDLWANGRATWMSCVIYVPVLVTITSSYTLQLAKNILHFLLLGFVLQLTKLLSILYNDNKVSFWFHYNHLLIVTLCMLQSFSVNDAVRVSQWKRATTDRIFIQVHFTKTKEDWVKNNWAGQWIQAALQKSSCCTDDAFWVFLGFNSSMTRYLENKSRDFSFFAGTFFFSVCNDDSSLIVYISKPTQDDGRLWEG